MDFTVYILYSESKDRYYVGSCADIQLRITQHNAGRNISTKAGLPWKLVYIEEVSTQPEARRREFEIKNKKSRKYIEWLITSTA